MLELKGRSFREVGEVFFIAVRTADSGTHGELRVPMLSYGNRVNSCSTHGLFFTIFAFSRVSTLSSCCSSFSASNGWLNRFKKRAGLKNVKMHGEAASANNEEAEKYKETFKAIIDEEGYDLCQIFNADETGLFWKKLPSRTYVTQEVNKVPGRKMMKDRLTLLLCANASGRCKVKPLLVYKSKTPRAFRGKMTDKSKLKVFWRSNKKAWVTREVFKDWLNQVFAPEVKDYLTRNNLDLKALLVLDNAPGHPPGESGLLPMNNWIKVSF